ncbi:hypothetical protein TKK_0017629 [Trichogramma kaykai]
MSKRKRDTSGKKRRPEELEILENENYYDVSVIPDCQDSGGSDCDYSSEADDESGDDNDSVINLVPVQSFRKVFDTYTDSQKNLASDHKFDWREGEKKYEETLENEIFLKDNNSNKIQNSSLTEIFEYFFSNETISTNSLGFLFLVASIQANFTSKTNLLVHMKKFGLRCTGTVRQDRLPKDHKIDKKTDEREEWRAMYDKNSGMNLITVMDSKPVSILSTAAGVYPTGHVDRHDKSEKMRKELDFPKAFCVYNQHKAGVDMHDQSCNKVLPIFRSKKWTWVIFIRYIQMSMTNATVLYNTVSRSVEKKIGTKEMAMAIAGTYLSSDTSTIHEQEISTTQKYCSKQNCKVRTRKVCKTCNLFFCKTCFDRTHPQNK